MPKRIIIKEDSLSLLKNKGNLLPMFLFDAVKEHKTSLGDSEAFPSTIGRPYDYVILKKRFNEVKEAFDTLGIENQVDAIEKEIARAIKRAKELETPITEFLEKLCENAVNNLFAVPKETVNFNLKLVDKVEVPTSANLMPSDDYDYDFEETEEVLSAKVAVEKRRVIDALILGAAYTYSNFESVYIEDLEKLNHELPSLYKKIRILDDYLLFIKKETMSDLRPMQGSYVITHLNGEGERAEIEASAILFPLLLKETIRGLFELFASHGLPHDVSKAKLIISKADYMMAEPWDLRLGVTMYKDIIQNVEAPSTLVPYFFMELVRMHSSMFYMAMRELLANTSKGRYISDEIVKMAQENSEYQEFSNRINTKRLDKTVIKETYFTATELDAFNLDSEDETSDVITDSINESILNESQESKSIAAAKKLAMQRLNYDEAQADEFVRVTLRNDIPVLRKTASKFILGVTRMALDGELNNANIISNINATLELVASPTHINEYDRNLNGLSATDIINQFSGARKQNIDSDKEWMSQQQFTNNGYEIVPINSFEEAQQYGEYTDWCITHYDNMFKSYGSEGLNQIYFCLKNGFEQVPREQGDGCPLDAYGLSMISVIVNPTGELAFCTSRWNHDFDGDDNIMNARQLSQVIGVNFYDTFKPNEKFKNAVDEILAYIPSFQGGYMKLENGNSLSLLDSEGLILVKVMDRFGVYDRNKNDFLVNDWFDYVERLENLFGDKKQTYKVSKNYEDAILLSDGTMTPWYANIGHFNEGVATLDVGDATFSFYNYIRTDGQVLVRDKDMFVVDICTFQNGLGVFTVDGFDDFSFSVDVNGYITQYDSTIKIVCDTFVVTNDSDAFFFVYDRDTNNIVGEYGMVEKINDDLAVVTNTLDVAEDTVDNLIGSHGRLLCDEWFDKIVTRAVGNRSSYLGCLLVRTNEGKHALLSADGQIKTKWYDSIATTKIQPFLMTCNLGPNREKYYNLIGPDFQEMYDFPITMLYISAHNCEAKTIVDGQEKVIQIHPMEEYARKLKNLQK